MQNAHTTPAFTAGTQPKGFAHTPSATAEALEHRAAQNQPAFIGYMPYGFPNAQTSIDALRVMVQHGVDIVEIGLPYSDPVMDGPVIQQAALSAIEAGERIRGVFDAVEAVAAAGAVPLVMSYWNLIFHYGVNAFARDFAAAGGKGLITPDLIPEEAGAWFEASERFGLDRIFLVSPDSTDQRLQAVSQASRGFVYAASRMGVTGERTTLSGSPQQLVERTRKAGADHVCVGIGVSTPEQGATVGAYADGVIVGSALVHTMLDAIGGDAQQVNACLDTLGVKTAQLADGIHHARKA